MKWNIPQYLPRLFFKKRCKISVNSVKQTASAVKCQKAVNYAQLPLEGERAPWTRNQTVFWKIPWNFINYLLIEWHYFNFCLILNFITEQNNQQYTSMLLLSLKQTGVFEWVYYSVTMALLDQWKRFLFFCSTFEYLHLRTLRTAWACMYRHKQIPDCLMHEHSTGTYSRYFLCRLRHVIESSHALPKWCHVWWYKAGFAVSVILCSIKLIQRGEGKDHKVHGQQTNALMIL